MAGDEPPYLSVGTDVSAKYKGAFCEAKIKKVVRSVKCKVNFKNNNGTVLVTDDLVRGSLRVGAHVEAKHPEKNQYLAGIIVKLLDYSQYTVVFDDGDETTLRRTSLCLKSGRHFAESETLDQLPLTHPEHFGTPVMNLKGGRKRRTLHRSPMPGDASSDDETPPPVCWRRKVTSKPKELDPNHGKVVCVDASDKKKQTRDNWFPALVVSPGAQEAIRIRTKDEYLVRSFKDGKYHVIAKKDVREFTREIGSKVDNNTLKTAVERAMQYVEKDELPPHWDRETLFRTEYASDDADKSDRDSDSDVSDDEPSEAKDRFVAQLYKFMDDRGTPINKAPSVSNRDLNLYKLFKVVQKSGGYNRVTNQLQWKSVYVKLGLPTSNSSASHQIKQAYKKYLHSFEGFERKLGCTMGSSTRSGRVRHRSERNLMATRDRDFKVAGRRKNEPKQVAEERPKTSDVDVKTHVADRNSDDLAKKSEKAEEMICEKSTGDVSAKRDRSLPPKVSKEVESKTSDSDDDHKPRSVARGGGADDPKSEDSMRRRGRKKKTKIKTEKPDNGDKLQDSEEEEEDEEEDAGCDVLVSVNDKVRVKYGRGRQQKIYEAKVLKTDHNDDGDPIYFVHYTGWNMRYDEWVRRHRIVENLTRKIPEKRFRRSGSKFRLGKRGRPTHRGFPCGPKSGGSHSSSGSSKGVGGGSDRGNRRGGGGSSTRSRTRGGGPLDSSRSPNGPEPPQRPRANRSSGWSDSESGGDGDSDAETLVRRTRSAATREDDADRSFEKDGYDFDDDEEAPAMASTKMSEKTANRRPKREVSGDGPSSVAKSAKKTGLRDDDENVDDESKVEGESKRQQRRKPRSKSTRPADEETIVRIERRGRKKKQRQEQERQMPASDGESEDGDRYGGDDVNQNEGVMDSELYFFESSKKEATSETDNPIVDDPHVRFVGDGLMATDAVVAASKSGTGDVCETDFEKHDDGDDSSASLNGGGDEDDDVDVDATGLFKQTATESCAAAETPSNLGPTGADVLLEVPPKSPHRPPCENETSADGELDGSGLVTAIASDATDDSVAPEGESASGFPAKQEVDVDVASPSLDLVADEEPEPAVDPKSPKTVAADLAPTIDEIPEEGIRVAEWSMENPVPGEPEKSGVEDLQEAKSIESSVTSIDESQLESKEAIEPAVETASIEVALPPSPPLPPPPPPVVLDKFDALLQDVQWRKSSCPAAIEVAGTSKEAIVDVAPKGSKKEATVDVAPKGSKKEATVDVAPKGSKKERNRKPKVTKPEKRKGSDFESDDDDENAKVTKKWRIKEDFMEITTAAVAKKSSKKSKEKRIARKSEGVGVGVANSKHVRRKECKRKRESMERRSRSGSVAVAAAVAKPRTESDDAGSASEVYSASRKEKIKKARKRTASEATDETSKPMPSKKSKPGVEERREQQTSDDAKRSPAKDRVSGKKRKEKGEKSSKRRVGDESGVAIGSEPIKGAVDVGRDLTTEAEPMTTKSIDAAPVVRPVAENNTNNEGNVPSYLMCEEDVPASPVTPEAGPHTEQASGDDASMKVVSETVSSVESSPQISAFASAVSKGTKLKTGTTDSSNESDAPSSPPPATTTTTSVDIVPCAMQPLFTGKMDDGPSDPPVADVEAPSSSSTARVGQISSPKNDGDCTSDVVLPDVAGDVGHVVAGGGDDGGFERAALKRPKEESTIAAASDEAAPAVSKRRRRNYKRQTIDDSTAAFVADLPSSRRTTSPGYGPVPNRPPKDSSARLRGEGTMAVTRAIENEEFVHMADMFLGVANSAMHACQHQQASLPVSTTPIGATTAVIHATPESPSHSRVSTTTVPPLSLLPVSSPCPSRQLPPAPRSPTKPSKFNFYKELDDFLDGSERIAVLQDRLTELRRTYLSLKAELACIDRRRKKLKRKEKEAKPTAVVN